MRPILIAVLRERQIRSRQETCARAGRRDHQRGQHAGLRRTADPLRARPSADDIAAVPHRLYGHVPICEGYSVGRFVREAEAVLRNWRVRNAYHLRRWHGALHEGAAGRLSPIPPIPPSIREHWRRRRTGWGVKAASKLADMDPGTAARLSPTDPQRIVRALEVIDATGGRCGSGSRSRDAGPARRGDGAARRHADRATLHERSDARFDEMMEHGALEEAERIAALDLDPLCRHASTWPQAAGWPIWPATCRSRTPSRRARPRRGGTSNGKSPGYRAI